MFPPLQRLQPLLVERALPLVNHLILAEPAAAGRLARHAGKTLMLRVLLPTLPALPGSGAGARPAPGQQRWEQSLSISGAGLFEPPDALPAGAGPAAGAVLVESFDLHVEIDLSRPVTLAQGLLAGERPAMRIEGDAGLATDFAWLKDNLRWDIEEDLSRLLGDAAAHEVAQRARLGLGRAAGALAALLRRARPESA